MGKIFKKVSGLFVNSLVRVLLFYYFSLLPCRKLTRFKTWSRSRKSFCSISERWIEWYGYSLPSYCQDITTFNRLNRLFTELIYQVFKVTLYSIFLLRLLLIYLILIVQIKHFPDWIRVASGKCEFTKVRFWYKSYRNRMSSYE